MPEHAEPPLVLFDLLQSRGSVVDTKVLMVLGGDLDQTASGVFVQGEVLDQIEQSLLLAGATNQRLQRDDSLFALAVDSLPIGEVFPPRCHAADLRLRAVR